MLDTGFNGTLDEGLALGDFAFDGYARAEGGLDGVDTSDWLVGVDVFGFFEEGGDVVEVAADESDVVGGAAGGETLGGWGGGIAGEGEDGELGAGWVEVEEGVDDCPALFAGGPSDEESFGHGVLWMGVTGGREGRGDGS